MVECNFLFPRVLWRQKNCGLDTDQFVKFARHCASTREGVMISNQGGYQSPPFSTEECNTIEPWKSLVDKIYPVVEAASTDLGFKKYRMMIGNGWININRRGDSNHLHNHLGPYIFSGVYYAKVPARSGEITFSRPFDEPHKLYAWAENDDVEMNTNALNEMSASYQPEEDEMFIFPSDLLHKVEVSESQEDRISYAFNVKIVSR